ncbi:unnamed protein product [Moneuplotes crassus]|uniref:USP domain-containing protein n=1 Tax=Euplotes crassus TaxID=5936 RepID=A0AAD2CV88_EUPCR|nr:unnamed protein product [Moneuplotes crassus]
MNTIAIVGICIAAATIAVLAVLMIWCLFLKRDRGGEQEEENEDDIEQGRNREREERIGEGKGIRNRGLDCFMNAPLQCFVGMDDFCDRIKDEEGINVDNDEAESDDELNGKSGVLEKFKRFIEIYKKDDNCNMVDCEFLREAFEAEFPSSEQHDTRQFIMELFEAIQSEQNISNQPFISSGHKDHKDAWEEYTKNNTSIIDDFFIGMYETKFQCECKEIETVYEQFNHISLPITIKNSLETFNLWLKNCKKNTYSEFKCKKCNSFKKFEIVKQITKFPQYLILAFERLDTHKNVKLDGIINFPLNFTMPDPDNNENNKQTIEYDLNSIINHSGFIHQGHYTAKSLRNDQWLNFNDSLYEPLLGPPINDPKAYILFYKKKVSS